MSSHICRCRLTHFVSLCGQTLFTGTKTEVGSPDGYQLIRRMREMSSHTQQMSAHANQHWYFYFMNYTIIWRDLAWKKKWMLCHLKLLFYFPSPPLEPFFLLKFLKKFGQKSIIYQTIEWAHKLDASQRHIVRRLLFLSVPAEYTFERNTTVKWRNQQRMVRWRWNFDVDS